MVLMVYAPSKGPRSNCLLADMKQIDQTTKVIRHLAPLDDFFFIFIFIFFFFFFFFDWGFTALQEYFTYIEPIVNQKWA